MRAARIQCGFGIDRVSMSEILVSGYIFDGAPLRDARLWIGGLHPALCQLGKVLERVVEVLPVERREHDLFAYGRRHR